MSYVGQSAFILNATLRDNVLFGREFDADRYERTVTACCMKPDIAMLPGRDQTEIGARCTALRVCVALRVRGGGAYNAAPPR